MSKTKIWTIETCILEAKKYDNVTDFRQKSKSAYHFAVENDLIYGKIFKEKRTKWDFEKCKIEALKFSTRGEFWRSGNKAYEYAKNNHILDEICSHMSYVFTKWNYENSKEEASKYLSRKKFEKKCCGAYNYARKNGFLDEICSHMTIYSILYRMVYIYLFSDNSVYIGLTYNINKRNSNHKKDTNSQVYKHILKLKEEPKLIQLSDYINDKDAQILEKETILSYKNKGFKILNVATGGSLGGNNLKWNKEKCKEEASKYSSRKEFQLNSPSAYQSTLKHGWMDEFIPQKLR